MRALLLVLVGLAGASSRDGLVADDACLSAEPGACSLNALQVAPPRKEQQVFSVGLSSQSALGAWFWAATRPENIRRVLSRLGHRGRDFVHLHLLGSKVPELEDIAKIYPQPPGETQDAWMRDLMEGGRREDPVLRAEYDRKQKVLIAGYIVLTILPLLVVSIEKPSKNSKPFEARPQTSLKITQKELSEHQSTSSLWISIGGVVCDVTEFLMLHPGGNDVLLQYGGQEAYDAFEEVGHSDFARKMVQEKAIGLLVDGQGPRSGAGTTLLGRLFTKEDGYNIHKVLGISVLTSVLYRVYCCLDMQWDGGFSSSIFSLGLCWLCMLLQSTSYLFEVPKARLLGSPMIWQEWRGHNFIFVSRHVLAFTITWFFLRYVQYSNQFASICLDLSMFVVLYGQLYAVDLVTAWVREDKHTSLTASWPFWEGCPLWLEKSIKLYYTLAQFQASTLLIMTGSKLFDKYMVIFPFQFASFLMTLVRKGIISTKGFHAGYLWSLWMVVWLILGADGEAHAAGWALWIMMYMVRSQGLSKYALWLGPLVPAVLQALQLMPTAKIWKFPVMIIVWIVCMGLQKLCIGFAMEVRARRFLEARQKPMKLLAKEKVNDTFFLLKFEVPAGYTAGINPGQHVKVYVPNISQNVAEWNKSLNLEEPVEVLSRSYTPVSATVSPTMDLMVRYYPKDSDRGFPDGGRGSTYLVDQLAVGSKIMMTGPHGHQLYYGQRRFLVEKSMVSARACGALAGGSGITPVLSTLRDIWQEGRRDIRDRDQRILGEKALRMEEFAVLHVTRSPKEALSPEWYAVPQDTQDITPIRVSHVVTGSGKVEGVSQCWTGKLTEEMVQKSLPAPADDVVIFVCGPQGFNESLCRPILQKLGYKNVVMLQ
ncbi:unnamed protein product [Effrenium voratum]|nr:unnamed protein product [Effrenium voratum]